MTIEEQRKAIIEDATKFDHLDMVLAANKAAGCNRPLSCDYFTGDFNLTVFLEEMFKLQAARNQSNNVPVANVESLEQWLIENMPAGTVIGDPKWWARKINNVIAFTSPQHSNALEILLYLQKHELWANSHAKEVINSAIKSAQPESDGK